MHILKKLHGIQQLESSRLGDNECYSRRRRKGIRNNTALDSARINERIFIGTFGAMRKNDEATQGYYLVKWITKPNTVKIIQL